jgi:hypothetical protein
MTAAVGPPDATVVDRQGRSEPERRGESSPSPFGAPLAGALSGIVGLLAFLTLHAVLIVPIWFVAPVGLLLATAGGAAVGLAYKQLGARLPRRPFAAPAMLGLLAVILAPAIGLAQIRQPMFVVTPAGERLATMSVDRIAMLFILELLVTSMLMGAAVGWALGRTRRAAAVFALAGVVVALGPGHNIPFLGATPAVGKEMFLLFVPSALAAIVLVEFDGWLRRWRPGLQR